MTKTMSLTKIINANISELEDMSELAHYENLDPEDLVELENDGFTNYGCVHNISPIWGATIADVLIEEIRDDGFQSMVEMINEDNPDNPIPANDEAQVEEFLCMNKLYHVKSNNTYYLVSN